MRMLRALTTSPLPLHLYRRRDERDKLQRAESREAEARWIEVVPLDDRKQCRARERQQAGAEPLFVKRRINREWVEHSRCVACLRRDDRGDRRSTGSKSRRLAGL